MPEKLPHPECARLTREMDARRDRETRKGPDGTPYWKWYYLHVQKKRRKQKREGDGK